MLYLELTLQILFQGRNLGNVSARENYVIFYIQLPQQ